MEGLDEPGRVWDLQPWAGIQVSRCSSGPADTLPQTKGPSPQLWRTLAPQKPKKPKVDLRFDPLRNTGHTGDCARGGPRHVRGTKWDKMGHRKKILAAARRLWHGLWFPRERNPAQILCQKKSAQQFATICNTNHGKLPVGRRVSCLIPRR